MQQTERFTERELEVLRFISIGKDNKSIAVSMCLTKKTIEHHVNGIMSKIVFPEGVNKRVFIAVNAASIAEYGNRRWNNE